MPDNTDPNSPPVPLAQNNSSGGEQQNNVPNPVQVDSVDPVAVPVQEAPASQEGGAGNQTPPPSGQPLDSAPESMRQQAPSSFDPAGGKRKGGKKGMFCTCTCGILAFLLLVTGGLFAYAYFTKTDIPVVSDIIEKIESMFRDPIQEAKEMQEKIASTLVSTLVPLAAKDDSLVSAIADSSVSGEYIKGLVDNYEEVKSVRFDLSGTATYSSSTSGEDVASLMSGGSMEMNLVGAYDGKEAGNEKAEAKFDINVEQEGFGMDMVGELRSVGSDTYIKLDTFPFLTSGTYGDIKGQWVDITPDDIDSASGLFGEGLTTESDEKQEVDNDDVAKLLEFITDESVVQNAELLSDETIGGEDCYCVKLSWNKEELKEVMKTYASIYEEEFNEGDIDESLEGFTKLEIEGCLGKTSEKIHRIGLNMQAAMDGQPQNVDLDLKLWDYDADIEITVPPDAKTWEDIMSEVDPTYNDYSVKSEMMIIRTRIEEYYVENEKYPSSLSVLDISSTVIEGETVHYQKTGSGYKLWITLPSGELYELKNF